MQASAPASSANSSREGSPPVHLSGRNEKGAGGKGACRLLLRDTQAQHSLLRLLTTWLRLVPHTEVRQLLLGAKSKRSTEVNRQLLRRTEVPSQRAATELTTTTHSSASSCGLGATSVKRADAGSSRHANPGSVAPVRYTKCEEGLNL